MDSITFDPLAILPIEIFEKIYKELSGSDLLTAIQLNSAWYDYIVNDQKTVNEKIKLKFKCNEYHAINPAALKALIESGRQFDHLELECCIYCLDKIYALLGSQEFKVVKMKRTSFVAFEQAAVFFSLIQNSVESIDMSEVQIKQEMPGTNNPALTFPKLKSLHVHNIQFLICQNIFCNVTTLEELSFTCQNQKVVQFHSIINLLKNNKNLKSLEISGSIFRQLFNHNMTAMVDLRLEKVSVKNFNNNCDVLSDMARPYSRFARLLKQSSETLKEVTIDKCMGKVVLKTILELPKLEKFTHEGAVDPFEEDFWINFTLETNQSITELNLPSNNTDVFKIAIKALPSLKLLKCDRENQEISEFLDEHCKKMSALKIEDIKEDRQKIFADMDKYIQNMINERFGR